MRHHTRAGRCLVCVLSFLVFTAALVPVANANATGYENPVYSAAAFPDPFVLDNGKTHSDYWAFGTGNLFPLLHSSDLVNWTAAGTALAAKPNWVVATGDWHPWAPSVTHTSNSCPHTTSAGCYVMYYVGLSAQYNVNCVAVATATTPGGPYVDQGPLTVAGSSTGMPIGCGDIQGHGNIDPSPFVDAKGQTSLYTSTDFDCRSGSCVLAPTVSVIPLNRARLHATGPRVPLFAGSAGTWESVGVSTPTVEGPSLKLHNGTYYLFYSGGSWQGNYAMGYAVASSPTGPFTKSAANPFFSGTSTVIGPGGGDALVTGPHGAQWMVYAARTSAPGAVRTLRIDPFVWQAKTTPAVLGPTSTAQTTTP